MGFTHPTPVQELAIPPGLSGRDLMVQAQTGTGKTVAFGIPLVEAAHEALSRSENKRLPVGLVLAPTRELAVQVANEVELLGKHRGVRTLPVYGGVSIERQVDELRRGTSIVVGTPGRIKDHLERRTLSLASIQIVVLDEADAMLDMGFIRDIESILERTPPKRQTMLFSATIPEEIARIAQRYMREPERIDLNPAEICAAGVQQFFYHVSHQQKPIVLLRLLKRVQEGLTLVFCQTKREVDQVSSVLSRQGIEAAALHGDFTQNKREEILDRFRAGEIPVLVATDVAARGIHVGEVNQVVNYGVPADANRYVHRIGRTGRAGKTGTAITLVTAHDLLPLKAIERAAKTRATLLWPPSEE